MVNQLMEIFNITEEKAKEKLEIISKHPEIEEEFMFYLENEKFPLELIEYNFHTVPLIMDLSSKNVLDAYIQLCTYKEWQINLSDIDYTKFHKFYNLETIPEVAYQEALRLFNLNPTLEKVSDTEIKMHCIYNTKELVEKYSNHRQLLNFSINSLEKGEYYSKRNLKYLYFDENSWDIVEPIRLLIFIKLEILLKGQDYVDYCREIYVKNKFVNDAAYLKKFSYNIKYSSIDFLTLQNLQFAEYLINNGYFYIYKNLVPHTENNKKLVCECFILDEFYNKTVLEAKAIFKELDIHNKYKLKFTSVTRNYIDNEIYLKFQPENMVISQLLILVSYLMTQGEYEKLYQSLVDKELENRKEVNEFYEIVIQDKSIVKIFNKLRNLNYKTINGVISGDSRDNVRLMSIIVKDILLQRQQIEEVEYLTMQQFSKNLTVYDDKTTKYYYSSIPKNKIIFLKGIDEFLEDMSNNSLPIYSQKAYKHLIKMLSAYEEDRYVFLLGDNINISKFLLLNKQIELLYSENTIYLKDLNSEEIFEIYMEYLIPELYTQLTLEFKEKFIEYLILNQSYFPIKNQSLGKYLATYSNNEKRLELPKTSYKNSVEILNNLIGLHQVKEEIQSFKTYVEFIQKAKDFGLSVPNFNMHMCFLGNPGTGKTTIARIIAEILYQIGMINENKLVEVSSKDLIAEYVGQTAPKTQKVIDEAMGGVLFIDEAYALKLNKDKASFGDEAIATLIKAMEDRKGEFVVIFAGYSQEMNVFLNANSGILSRIGYTFDFPDYSAEELLEIYKLKMLKNKMVISEDCLNELSKTINYFIGVKDIGNARFVDRLVQMTLINHSKNYEKIDEILLESIPKINDIIKILPKSSVVNITNISDDKLKRIAVHELGHAIVIFELLPLCLKEISIIPKGIGSLGSVTLQELNEVNNESDLCNLISSAYAGMLAEEVFFGEHDVGCISDFEYLKEIAHNMVELYDMGDRQLNNIDREKDILKKCMDTSLSILTRYKEKMNILINILIEEKFLSKDRFIELVQ